MTWVTSEFDTAVTGLSSMSSFLAFEFLKQSDRGLSRVFDALCTNGAFGLISVWNPELSVETNVENTAHLLLDMKRVRAKPIQLLAHPDEYVSADADYQPPERGFFTLGGSEGWLLALCRKYRQERVAVTVGDQVKVLDSTGAVVKTFTRDLIEPHHLKQIWSAVTGRDYAWLESGFMDANPFFLCGQIWDRTGLLTDIPVYLRPRCHHIHDLMRERPFRSKEEIAQARIYDIQVRSEILATQIIKASNFGKTERAAKFQQELAEFCAKHNLVAEQVMHEKLMQFAEILAINLSAAQARGNEAREERCRSKLLDFCHRHQVSAEQAISNVEKRFRRLEH